jgi:hypothetical protein
MAKFEKGNRLSLGRRPGSRNKSTLWREALDGDRTGEVIRVVQEQAEQGDMFAASLVLARTWPRRRGRPVELDLPPVDGPGGLVAAYARLIAAMSEGEITPEEASSVAKVLEAHRHAIETNDHEQRIQELKEMLEARTVNPQTTFPFAPG